MTTRQPFDSVEEVFDLLLESQPSVSEDDDQVGVVAHGLQCGHELEKIVPDDLELHVAGLLHDVGHIVMPDAADAHGVHGGALLAPLLGERVGKLIELHVPAKRWMVTIDPGYRSRLSATSVRTLREQGDAMTEAEVEAFTAEPLRYDAVLLRLADDAAKTPGRTVPGLDHWRPKVAEVARRRQRAVHRSGVR